MLSDIDQPRNLTFAAFGSEKPDKKRRCPINFSLLRLSEILAHFGRVLSSLETIFELCRI
jgi:hypothetical protein